MAKLEDITVKVHVDGEDARCLLWQVKVTVVASTVSVVASAITAALLLHSLLR